MERRRIEVVDATILGTLDECARKCQYRFQCGMCPSGEQMALHFGQSYHMGVYTGYVNKKDVETAVRAASIQFGNDSLDEDEIRTGAKLEELLRARDRLFRNEEWEWLGGEQQFVLDIPGVPLRYAGFIDAFGKETTGEQQYVIQEEKTSKNPWAFVTHPNAQITGYVYAARTLFQQDIRRAYVTMAGIYTSSVDGRVKGKKKTDQPREVINREVVDLNPWDLDEWVEELKLKVSTLMAYEAFDWWPKNTRSCGNYGSCPYQAVCLAPPNMREAFLENSFTQEFWEPLMERR
jgi:hypothetical protein